jgi:hypothetical protein
MQALNLLDNHPDLREPIADKYVIALGFQGQEPV